MMICRWNNAKQDINIQMLLLLLMMMTMISNAQERKKKTKLNASVEVTYEGFRCNRVVVEWWFIIRFVPLSMSTSDDGE
jgi:hypothetical protein